MLVGNNPTGPWTKIAGGTLPHPEDSKPQSLEDRTRPPLVVYQVDTASMAQVKPDLATYQGSYMSVSHVFSSVCEVSMQTVLREPLFASLHRGDSGIITCRTPN